MTRRGLVADKYFESVPENSQSPGVRLGLQGTAAPGGDAGDQDGASLGSLFHRTDTGQIYYKTGSANSTADWTEFGNVTIDQLSWRNEKVVAATNDTLAPGSGIDPTAWTDNESGTDATNWNVGDHVLGDVDGTPALLEITAKASATSITLAAAGQALADNDTFIVQSYFPDTPGAQEDQAIVHFPSATGAAVKIGDVNWNFADGINMASGYTAGNGTISSSDTVNSAIQKLDGNQQDIQSASGLAQGDVDYGTFTGNSLADNQTSKQLFQRIETLLEQLRGVQVTGITTVTAVDAVPHATVKACKWLVEVFEEATPANRQAFEVYALTDGTSVDDTVYAKLKLGSNFNLTITTAINGANMELRAASSTAGVTVTARRIEVLETTL